MNDLIKMIKCVFIAFERRGLKPRLTSYMFMPNGNIVRPGSHKTGHSFDFAPSPTHYHELPAIANILHELLKHEQVHYLGRLEGGHIHITLINF